jgi:hypothetical protein
MKRLFRNSGIFILLFWTIIYLPSCKKEETPPTPPVVATINVSDITSSAALIEGDVVNDGGTEITDLGICWSTSPNPTISSNKTIVVTGSNPFTGSITGLTADTKYYVRAYATNSAGTSYGNEVTFTTNNITKATTIPTLTTTDITSITSTTAVSGGTITDDGGGDITSRGIYLNLTPGSDIYPDIITNDGTGTGSFVSHMSDLSPGTTYYVTAYAVNSAGTGFGPTISFTTSFEQNGVTWIKKADFPPEGGRYDAAGFSIGTKIYIGPGYDWADNNRNDLWEYDPAINNWTQKASFPGKFNGSCKGFSIGDKGYVVVLNVNYINISSSTNDLWEYDPSKNVWTQKASVPKISSEYVGVAFSIGTKGYVGIGYDDNAHSAREFWEWDPMTNSWSEKKNYPGKSTMGAVGFSIGTKGYIGTGSGYGNVYYQDFWEWDQATNTWTKKADFAGTARYNAIGFSIGNKGYLATGGANSAHFRDFWEWDQATNVWIQKVNFGGVERFAAVGISTGNKAYIGTGIGKSSGNEYSLKDLWEYDPNPK